jgi:hypothetical protein
MTRSIRSDLLDVSPALYTDRQGLTSRRTVCGAGGATGQAAA